MQTRHIFLTGLCLYTLSGCVAQHNPAGTASAIKPVPINQSIIEVDAAQGAVLIPGGRVAISSWHAGLNRDQQVFCWEPADSMAAVSFERFEYCLEYLNGARSRENYNMLIEKSYADQQAVILNNP